MILKLAYGHALSLPREIAREIARELDLAEGAPMDCFIADGALVLKPLDSTLPVPCSPLCVLKAA
ncbi:MAG: hypothetical protein LBR71_02815 [Synergistaceae bacterium]|nr:hypothetical protein [Synergistaceae bacterium]